MNRFVLLLLIISTVYLHAQARSVQLHLHLFSPDDQVIFLQQYTSSGKLLTDTIYYPANGTLKKSIQLEYANGILYLATRMRVQVPVYVASTANDIHVYGTSINGRIDSITFDKKDNINRLLNAYMSEMMSFIFSYSYVQEFIFRYPFNDEYVQSLKDERDKKLKHLNIAKAALLKCIPKNEALLRDYIQIHYALINNNVRFTFDMKRFGDYCKIIQGNQMLLATDLPDALIGSVFMLYNSVPDSFAKPHILNTTDLILFIDSTHLKLRDRMGGTYLSFLSEIKDYKRIENLFSNGVPFNNVVNNSLIGQKATLVGNSINELNIPMHISDFKKKYNVVFIWSTDCGHCRQALHSLNEIYIDYKNMPLQFYSFNIEPIDATVLDTLNWKIKSILQGGWNNSFLISHGINYTPLILLLNDKGIIISQPSDINDLKTNLNAILKDE